MDDENNREIANENLEDNIQNDTAIDEGDTSNDGESDAADDGEAQITIGEFSIGFDASRIGESNSGFFVADNVDTGAILFDVSNPGTLSVDNDQFSIYGADLLVSPEFAAALGDESLDGADIGDTRIDADLNILGDNSFSVESGVTSVFLDLPLIESATGLELASVDSEAEPFSDEFQVGFNINDETDFTFDLEEGFSPIDGTIEHDGTVTFNAGITSEPDSDDADEVPIDEEDTSDDDAEDNADSNDDSADDDTVDETPIDEEDTADDGEAETPVDEDDSSSSDFVTIDLTDLADQTVEFTVSREAGFDNTVGFYQVNEDGSVQDPISGDAIAIGEAGYQDAALANSLDFTLSTGNGEVSTFTADLAGGTQYGTFIIADGGLDELLDGDSSNDPAIYFDTAEANASGFDHIRTAGSNVIEYEDLPNGTNGVFNDVIPDFNDIVVEYDFV